MTIHSPFQAKQGSNQVLTATGTSANTTIDASTKSVRVVNSGSNIAYFRIGTGAQTATTTDTPILSGESLIVEKAQTQNNLAYISASGTTLNVQDGEGGF